MKAIFFGILGHTCDVIQFNNNSRLGVHISQLQAVKKDFTVIQFSRECRKFFRNHINCLNSEKTEVKISFHMHFKKVVTENRSDVHYFLTDFKGGEGR